jgi:hypothetical protein
MHFSIADISQDRSDLEIRPSYPICGGLGGAGSEYLNISEVNNA